MDKLTVRRKLLRGSLSAPVVLTVASPSNLAAASTTCLVNTNQTVNVPPRFTDPTTPDTVYVRKTVPVVEVYVGSNWLTGSYYQLNGTGTYYSVATGASAGTVTNTRTPAIPQLDALAYLDSQGKVVGYGWPVTNGGGLWTSIGCWNSLLISP